MAESFWKEWLQLWQENSAVFPNHKADFRPRKILLFPELYLSQLTTVRTSFLISSHYVVTSTMAKESNPGQHLQICSSLHLLYSCHPNQYLSNWNPPRPKSWLSDLYSLTPIVKGSNIQSQMIDFAVLNDNQSAKINPLLYKLHSTLSISASEISLEINKYTGVSAHKKKFHFLS